MLSRMITLLVVLFTAFSNAQAADAPMLDGICYGPYRDNESPHKNVFPLPSNMEAELRLAKALAHSVRTYSVSSSLFTIPAICEKLEIDCYPGAWLGRSKAANDLEIELLVQVAKQQHDHVRVLIVGNEALHRGDVTEAQLLKHVAHVRQATQLPIAVAETWHAWKKHPKVAAEVDLIMAQVYPYWDKVPIDKAAQYTLDAVKTLQKMYPTKRIILSETGWPTAGEKQGPAVASAANAAKYFKEVTTLLRKNDIACIYFAMFDEAWKVRDEKEQGRHWGLFESNGNIKKTYEPLLPEAVRNGMHRQPRTLNYPIIELKP